MATSSGDVSTALVVLPDQPVMRDLSKMVLQDEHCILLVLFGWTVWVLQMGQRCPLAMAFSLSCRALGRRMGPSRHASSND